MTRFAQVVWQPSGAQRICYYRLVKREIGPSVAAPDPWLAVLGTGFILPLKDRRVGPVWNTYVENIAHRVNGGYLVGPEGAMVGGAYDAARDHPLGSPRWREDSRDYVGGRRRVFTLPPIAPGGGQSGGTRFTALTNSGEKASAKPESLADANFYVSFLLQVHSPRLGVLTR